MSILCVHCMPDAEGFYESLHKSGYKLKGIGFLKYHLGGDFK